MKTSALFLSCTLILTACGGGGTGTNGGGGTGTNPFMEAANKKIKIHQRRMEPTLDRPPDQTAMAETPQQKQVTEHRPRGKTQPPDQAAMAEI